MKYEYTPRGVCSRKIEFDINDGIVSGVSFQGGCSGNLKAISKLVDGMSAEKLESILKGNKCGMKGTSCADQLARAVSEAAKKEKT